MSEKLTTAQELFDLFSDEEKLKNYNYRQPVISDCGINNEEFHMVLPYKEIKEIVEYERERFLAAVSEPERGQLRWEHVGSTSIEGMPGTKFPDALLIIPEFPPSKPIIQGFLDCGYYFSRASPLDARDLWFFYIFEDGICKHHKLTVHVVTEDNKGGKILRETRDMCRNEEWAFEDYKAAKIEASKAADFIGYKMGKGKNSKLLEMLRNKHKD